MARVYDEFDPGYAVRCSDVTLCSEPQGFFSSLASSAAELTDPAWLSTLDAAVGDGAKLDVVYGHTEVTTYVYLSINQCLKQEY